MPADSTKQVDAYIAKAPEFTRPILEKLRKAFHRACPQVEEAIKWGVPHFQYKGILGGMAAFKNHVSFGFWKSKLMPDPEQLFVRGPKASMCNCQIRSAKEMPSQATLVSYVKEAMRLNDDDVKPPKLRSTKPPVKIPPDLKKILNLAKNRPRQVNV